MAEGKEAAATEGEGSSEMEFTNIVTTSDSFESSVVFHIVTAILGFALFMHQQIPSTLQDITFEFDELHREYKDLEETLSLADTKGSIRRNHAARRREVKHGIRRLEKLMTTITNVKTALELMITEIPGIENVILVMGPSPIRPLHVYELCFSRDGRVVSGDFAKSKVAESLSKRAIRELISKGAGSSSYAGPTKLFVLVKAPSSFNSPLHFLPKRDFRSNKKILPFKLLFKCKNRASPLEMDAKKNESQTANSMQMDSTSDDTIWFLCRHIIKGLPAKASPADD